MLDTWQAQHNRQLQRSAAGYSLGAVTGRFWSNQQATTSVGRENGTVLALIESASGRRNHTHPLDEARFRHLESIVCGTVTAGLRMLYLRVM